MTLTIFCPSNHLILNLPRCPQCGWQRPAAGVTGTPAWNPVQLKAGLGGPGRHVFARPVVCQGILALPLNNHELVGLGITDGRERWCTPLADGLMTRHLFTDGKRLLASLSDERPIVLAGAGQLASIDPVSGKLATVWNAESHQLSSPLLTEKYILIRTAASELVALNRSARSTPAWRLPLNTWWPLLPLAAGGKVIICDGIAMQGEGCLAAFSLEDGSPAWNWISSGMLTQPLAFHENTLILQNGHKQIVALDLQSGQEAWKLDFANLYTPPVVAAGLVYFAMRGSSSRDTPGYYLLRAIDPLNGATRWETPLPGRVMIPPLWFEDRLYLASEDGRLFAFNAVDGNPVFEQAVSTDEDPPRTELVVADGILFLGTYSGLVFALRIAEKTHEPGSPKELIERGEYDLAARAYALQGNYRQAAKILADPLQEYPKALALYEHAKLYKEAASLATSQGLLAEAERFFGLAGDFASQAEIFLKRGNDLEAARCFEQAGDLDRAARLYEQAGEPVRARDLYQHLNDIDSYTRVAQNTPASLEMVDYLIDQERLPEAAETAVKAGLLRKTADIYKQIGDEAKELDMLLRMAESEPEEWVFERIALLARKGGRFAQEAEALEHLGAPRRTAEAYQRAAMQTEQISPSEKARIIFLYEKATRYYADCDLTVEEAFCRDKVARQRQLPIILIDGQTRKEFKEFEWNTLELTVSNSGYGIAKQVHWNVSADKFDFDAETGVWVFPVLGEGLRKVVSLFIRPKKGEIGEAVPFSLEWAWQSREGEEFNARIVTSVPVKGKDDSRSTGQPVILQGGTLIQAEKYVHGDDLASGAQKGDKVEIRRGSGVSLSTSESRPDSRAVEKPSRVCPNCSMQNDADAGFCVYCQAEMPVQKTKRRREAS